MQTFPKRVTMIQTLSTARQGYRAGKEYEIGPDIDAATAADLIRAGLAVAAEVAEAESVVEMKPKRRRGKSDEVDPDSAS